jgi:hypothetical protein
MTSTIFVWDMAETDPHGERGVGHASIQVGDTYISWWPAKHSVSSGILSRARRHTMAEDRAADGIPQFASRNINNLDESAIHRWWRAVRHANDQDLWTHEERRLGSYRFLSNNCATTVFRALLIGSDKQTFELILASYTLRSALGHALIDTAQTMLVHVVGGVGSNAGVRESLLRRGAEALASYAGLPLLAVTPADIRAIAVDVWG